MWEIQHTGEEFGAPIYIKYYKYSNFGDYCEDELGIHRKKAERLVKIWQVVGVNLAGLPPEVRDRLVSAGFSKLKELVRVLTFDNAAAWAEKATQQSYQQLLLTITKYNTFQEEQLVKSLQKKKEAVALITGVSKGEIEADADEVEAAHALLQMPTGPWEQVDPSTIYTETTIPWRLALYPDQHSTMSQAIKIAQGITGSNSRTHNMTMIALEFLANSADKHNLPEYLAKLEESLGIKLVAFTHNGDPLYGISNLVSIANKNDETSYVSN